MFSQWLTRLIDLEAPRGATLQSAELGFRGALPWWLAVGLVVAAGAAVVYLYLHEVPGTPLRRKLAMALLRTAGLGVLIVLLMRPVLVGEYVGQRPRDVVVLGDLSLSMADRDERTAPQDLLRAAIALDRVAPNASPGDARVQRVLTEPAAAANPQREELVRGVLLNRRLDLLGRLGKVGPVRMMGFGGHVQPLGVSLPQPERDLGKLLSARWNADQPRTALADAILACAQPGDADPPAAIVVPTDGRDNASRWKLDEAARRCAELQVPLYIYGVGGTERRELRIKDADAPEILFCDDQVAVPVRWRAKGVPAGTVRLTATLAGRVVAERELPAAAGDDLRETLNFVPKKTDNLPEKAELVVAICSKETPDLHHEILKRVGVLDRRIRVLYIEDQPRWQFKYLQAALLRDRRVEASFHLAGGDPEALKSGPPYVPAVPPRQELFAYDLVILGDVPAEYLTASGVEAIRDFVEQGGGLVLIAGRQHMPSGYAATALCDVVPAEWTAVKFAPAAEARPKPFVPVLTDAGRRSEMMALAEEQTASLETWAKLEGWTWCYPAAKLRPGAVALLAHPKEKMGDEPLPLVMTQSYGRGAVLFLASDQTWHWRYNAGDKHFARFWGQVVYQFGLPHLARGPARAQLALEHPKPLLGRPCSMYARLLDESYRPLEEPRVTARLARVGGQPGESPVREVSLDAVPGRPGEYRGVLANDAAGVFDLRLEDPAAASLAYEVTPPPQYELEPGGMAEEALREAARLSGGRFYREEDLHRLPDQVEARSAEFTMRAERLLWNPLMLIVFVALVSAEWVVRKLSNLV